MKIEQASRKKAKIKLALQGPSGSGKTMSALLLAYGICGNYSKIVVIDTENHSAELYSHLGKYNVVNIGAPFTPEKYCEAIKLCEASGMEVIIIDSISHEWEGSGGILDIHSNMVGNSFTNWSKLTPRHNNFIQTILHSPCHVLGTIRSKQDYVLTEKNGKMVPEKVGLKGVTREGMDYEFTIVLDLDIKHNASASKDRTQLFSGHPEFKITSDTGKKILQWCESGESITPQSTNNNEVEVPLEVQISNCSTIKELIELYGTCSQHLQSDYRSYFAIRRDELTPSTNPIAQISKSHQNGHTSVSTS
ncbi:MAG: AAA family ATPase [Bacteroidetes bacterium]|nr:AAA family ATPase [Bacteroidota bacterium]